MNFKNISPQLAKELMDKENPMIVDVREEDEYRMGHIDKALLLPLGTIKQQAETILKDKEATILVYCRSGKRSQAACNILKDLGYKDVSNFGGILDWPYEIKK